MNRRQHGEALLGAAAVGTGDSVRFGGITVVLLFLLLLLSFATIYMSMSFRHRISRTLLPAKLGRRVLQ